MNTPDSIVTPSQMNVWLEAYFTAIKIHETMNLNPLAQLDVRRDSQRVLGSVCPEWNVHRKSLMPRHPFLTAAILDKGVLLIAKRSAQLTDSRMNRLSIAFARLASWCCSATLAAVAQSHEELIHDCTGSLPHDGEVHQK
jgi:hypothetical protein